MTNNIDYISLSELNSLVGKAIATQLKTSYWIVAEVVELRENYSGHCYLVLADKEEDKILAQSRASIWQQTYRMVKPYFESSTGQALAAGLKIRVKVAVTYHNVYGINLTVQDIDPAYTVGELTIRRQQILNQLEEDGVLGMNQELELPIVPQRIAVISSPTAAGYEDFVNQLQNNSFGYKFSVKLFPATMQGEKAEESIINAMELVYEQMEFFDALVVIRGGGASLDLSCFDNYNLAYYITQFPMPVIVGIGHERDETVLDFVAHTSLKTPTAVAAFFVEHFQMVDGQIEEVMERLQIMTHRIVTKENQRIQSVVSALPLIAGRLFSEKRIEINENTGRLSMAVYQCLRCQNERIVDISRNLQMHFKSHFMLERQRLERAQLIANLSDPSNVIKKGYSITTKDGKVVKSKAQIKAGDELQTLLSDGKNVSSIVS